MNIAKVKNSAAIVNYVKPGLEMVDLEIEAAILSKSITTGDGPDPDAGKPVQPGGGGGASGSTYRPRTIRR